MRDSVGCCRLENLFNGELSPTDEVLGGGIRDYPRPVCVCVCVQGEGCGCGGIYLMLHYNYHNVSALRRAAGVNFFRVLSFARGEVTRQCPQTTTGF